MPTFQTYNVTPILPAALEPLREMSFNLWWTWEPAARRLFRHLDPELWNRTNHNPVRMLQLSRQSRLEELAQDKTFLRELKQVFEEFEKYLGRHDTYGKTGAGSAIKNPIAYFSAEFGFHESIPNYSGGLGILAGDHCKSASDLDLNFVAIGLLYRHGYFRQQIDKNGVQAAINLESKFLSSADPRGASRRHETSHLSANFGTRSFCPALGIARWPGKSLPPRYGHPGKQRRGPINYCRALWRRP